MGRIYPGGKSIKRKTGSFGIALPESGDQELFINMLAQQNQSLLDEEGNIRLNTKEAKHAAKLIKEMIDSDIVHFYGAQDAEKAFQESAMFVAGGWYATNMSLNFPDASDKWRMAPLIPFQKKIQEKVQYQEDQVFMSLKMPKIHKWHNNFLHLC